MRQVVRDIGIYVVLLLVVTGGIWFYNNYKEDVLSYSLNLLGDKLLSMVPNVQDRAAIETMYAKFTDQVREQQVPPEHIETIAANILNLSQNDAKLTPDQVESILYVGEIPKIVIDMKDMNAEGFEYQFETSEFPDSVVIPEINIPDIPVMPEITKFVPMARPKHAEPARLVVVGERLKSMCEFSEKLQTIVRSAKPDAPELRRHWQFRNDNGLKIAMDPQVKIALKRMAVRNLDQEIAHLDKEKMVEWDKDLQKELAGEMRRVRMELLSLERLMQSQTEFQVQEHNKVRALLSLKELEALNYMREVKIDSVMQNYREKMSKREEMIRVRAEAANKKR